MSESFASTGDDRFSRQIRFAPIGPAGQAKLAAATVVVIGCGALGSNSSNLLARAGVGSLRLIDRDIVELSNLQRQVLFDEHDAALGLPKAAAAAEKLAAINSGLRVTPVVADLTHHNADDLLSGADLLVDGSDNFEARMLVNDFAVSRGVPWIYAGCIGAEGQSLTVVPGKTACLRCIMPEPPSSAELGTCDTVGVLGPAAGIAAGLQASEAMRLLVGADSDSGDAESIWTIFSLWPLRFKHVKIDYEKTRLSCPACGAREFPWLNGQRASASATLCGRNAVQIAPETTGRRLSLGALSDRWHGLGAVTLHKHFARLEVASLQVTVFADGRAIIAGVDSPAIAKAAYARYVGG